VTVEVEFQRSERGKIQRLRCQQPPCLVKDTGIENPSKQAAQQKANLLLIGQIKKMSTLVGQVKFAVIDLKTNRPRCDRYLTYRGDSDEAWRRAARFLVKDLVANCLK
jgi:hypothetical protein